jgi:hypothetical protein
MSHINANANARYNAVGYQMIDIANHSFPSFSFFSAIVSDSQNWTYYSSFVFTFHEHAACYKPANRKTLGKNQFFITSKFDVP